jgi:hypothetical protein
MTGTTVREAEQTACTIQNGWYFRFCETLFSIEAPGTFNFKFGNHYSLYYNCPVKFISKHGKRR